MTAKKVYLISWEPWGHEDWNIFVDDEGLKAILDDVERHGWVKPEVHEIFVEDVAIYLEMCAKASVCNATPEIIRKRLLD